MSMDDRPEHLDTLLAAVRAEQEREAAGIADTGPLSLLRPCPRTEHHDPHDYDDEGEQRHCLGLADGETVPAFVPGTVRYRKRPVVVDTIQWTGNNERQVQAFTGGPSHFYALSPEDREGCDDPEATATVFDKLHSTWVLVYTGQHIVRGVKGEYYPIAEDVLAETYEPVSGSS